MTKSGTIFTKINEKNSDDDFKFCETCMELLKISKNYKQFLLPNKRMHKRQKFPITKELTEFIYYRE